MPTTPRCFVIMPYLKKLSRVWDVISETIEKRFNGKAIRSDKKVMPGGIHQQMQSDLKSADFCVADVTGNNPNVMWEVGFAQALDKPVICLRQKTDDLPFNIQSDRMFRYSLSKLPDLAEKLTAVIQSVLDQLATHPPPTGWRYDELSDLRTKLKGKRPTDDYDRSIWEILSKAARSSRGPWTEYDAPRLMKKIQLSKLKVPEYQNTFWWLIAYGVFGYDQIDTFVNYGNGVIANIELVRITNRGLKLLELLRNK